VRTAQWAHGYHQQFGLYAWSPGDGAKRTQRAATPALAAIYADLPAKMAHARETAQGTKSGGAKAQLAEEAQAATGENGGGGSPRTVLQVRWKLLLISACRPQQEACGDT
jgi:hypothetical protein